jgi:hypothetical protein
MTHNDIRSYWEDMQTKLEESGLYQQLLYACQVIYMNLATTGQTITNIIIFGNGSLTDTMDVAVRRRRIEQLTAIINIKNFIISKWIKKYHIQYSFFKYFNIKFQILTHFLKI